MPRALTSDSSLDTLKKDAKRWLRALRDGDAAAQARLLAATPAAPALPGLRDVQLALAREYGLPGWAALRAALEEQALARRSQAERIAIVLRAAWDGGDRPAALRILARWPELGAANLPMAVVTGNWAAFQRHLAADPGAASRKTGPLGWQPLLYLAYARLPGGDAQAVAMAQALLDQGADPDAWFDDGWENPFTALTGVIGEGEGYRLPHPRAAALAALLVERGASPFDTQALYNTSITGDDATWLDFLWTRCEARGLTASWRTVPSKIGGRVPMSLLDYLLGNAVAQDHRRRAGWLLAHGAGADGVHAYSGRPLREEALIHGYGAMAALLERHGAAPRALTGTAGFQAACMRPDADAARAMAAARPGCLGDAAVMLTAARLGRVDVLTLLLELGMDVDVMDATGQRGLHSAVAGDSLAAVRLLVAHGADIDRPTTQYGGPLGFAVHGGQREIAAFLAPLSRDVPCLVRLGMQDRLRALFAAEPGLVNAPHPRSGNTPLFALPDEEAEALAMAEFLLAQGADPVIRGKDGLTPAEAARKRGLEDAADLLHGEAAGPGD
ncbi:MAG TPA: ankyrin repeat domain-containing protein [Roseomonas sp.]|jgi:hypothetical protein